MPKIFITGRPHSGKSTLLERVVTEVEDKQGFLTREVIHSNERTGFQIVTANNHVALLASIRICSGPRVGKYHVSLAAINKIMPWVTLYDNKDILYIDEIGEMQLGSSGFVNLVNKYLASPNTLIATVSEVFDHPFITELKSRPDSIWFSLTSENRQQIYERIKSTLQI